MTKYNDIGKDTNQKNRAPTDHTTYGTSEGTPVTRKPRTPAPTKFTGNDDVKKIFDVPPQATGQADASQDRQGNPKGQSQLRKEFLQAVKQFAHPLQVPGVIKELQRKYAALGLRDTSIPGATPAPKSFGISPDGVNGDK